MKIQFDYDFDYAFDHIDDDSFESAIAFAISEIDVDAATFVRVVSRPYDDSRDALVEFDIRDDISDDARDAFVEWAGLFYGPLDDYRVA
jgi:hypothetical protein